MNLVADEDVDAPIVHVFERAGHQVLYVAEMGPGMLDDAVLELARAQQALLLTADKGFGELVFRQRLLTSGVVLIRLAGLAPERKVETVTNAIKEHADQLHGRFAVIAPGTI